MHQVKQHYAVYYTIATRASRSSQTGWGEWYWYVYFDLIEKETEERRAL
jgi:hypothetical protein